MSIYKIPISKIFRPTIPSRQKKALVEIKNIFRETKVFSFFLFVQTFKESEEYRTGIPGDNIHPNPPFTVDTTTKVQDPIHLQSWIEEHKEELKNKKTIYLYKGGETTVRVETGKRKKNLFTLKITHMENVTNRTETL